MTENQTKWKNTLAAFRRQFTQITKLIADAKVCSDNLKDPRHEMDAKQARRHVEARRQKGRGRQMAHRIGVNTLRNRFELFMHNIFSGAVIRRVYNPNYH